MGGGSWPQEGTCSRVLERQGPRQPHRLQHSLLQGHQEHQVSTEARRSLTRQGGVNRCRQIRLCAGSRAQTRPSEPLTSQTSCQEEHQTISLQKPIPDTQDQRKVQAEKSTKSFTRSSTRPVHMK